MVPLLRRSHGERQGGLPIFTAQGDLATLAGALADLLTAPVTIEDPDTLVLAYSGGQQDVDDARVRTILARQVPRQLQERSEEHTSELQSRGHLVCRLL